MTARLPVWDPVWVPRPPWFDHAACRGTDVALFHPERGDTGVEAQARKVCATCPVRDQCLTHAVTHHEIHGIWGGTSARERRRLRHRARP
jgi:WhiB family redox-sensing transcriptional regulator